MTAATTNDHRNLLVADGFTIEDIAEKYVDDVYWPALRIYVPEYKGKKLPIHIFLHGGGWIGGTLSQVNDYMSQAIAKKLQNQIVVRVEYRLAPETKFPGPVYDCINGIKWAIDNADKYNGDINKISLHGESSGGNLAIASMIKILQSNYSYSSSPIKLDKNNFCALVVSYPVTDYSQSTESYVEYGNSSKLTKESLRNMWDLFLDKPDIERFNILASPDRASVEDVQDFPPSFIILADYDPLRDEGINFYNKLNDSSVESQISIYPNLHGFMRSYAKSGNIDSEIWNEFATFMESKCSTD